MADLLKIVVTTPVSAADAVRAAIGNAGAGAQGNYAYCSFTSSGTGRFLPLEGAHPTIGTVGTLEEVPEERIEVTCPRALIDAVLEAVREAHPYEEPVIDIFPLLSRGDVADLLSS